jgi:AraC-like DNA-binding protein
MEDWVHHYIAASSREKSWGLYVTGVGHALVKADSIYPPVAHPAGYDFKWERGRILEEFALLYLAAGSGVFESAHQPPLPIHTGDCILLFPGEWHRYRPDKSSGWDEYWVTFHGSLVESWRKAHFIRPQIPLLSSGTEHLLLPLFEDLLRLAELKSRRRHLESAALCHLLVARLLSSPKKTTRSESRELSLSEAGDYLRMHPEKDIDLAKLAKRLGMSYSNFRRSFARHFGASPDRFHQEARIARVKQLLTETELPLKSIAERLGYSNEFYMMHVFKRQTGSTPTQWRNRRTPR